MMIIIIMIIITINSNVEVSTLFLFVRSVFTAISFPWSLLLGMQYFHINFCLPCLLVWSFLYYLSPVIIVGSEYICIHLCRSYLSVCLLFISFSFSRLLSLAVNLYVFVAVLVFLFNIIVGTKYIFMHLCPLCLFVLCFLLTCDQASFFRSSAKEKQHETRRSVGGQSGFYSEARKSTPDTFTARVVCRQSRIWTFV